MPSHIKVNGIPVRKLAADFTAIQLTDDLLKPLNGGPTMSMNASRSSMTVRFLVFVSTFSLLLILIHVVPTSEAQEGMRQRSDSGDLQCATYCSRTEPGVGLMEVSVRIADQQLNETELRSKARQQALEVTVYADGFQRGLYAAVSSLGPKAPFVVRPRPGKVPTRAQTRIPGLDKLVIRDVGTRFDKYASSFFLLQPDPPAPKPNSYNEVVAVRLTGMDPGLNYTFRVPGKNSFVMCQAVVCPVDKISAPRNRPRSNR